MPFSPFARLLVYLGVAITLSNAVSIPVLLLIRRLRLGSTDLSSASTPPSMFELLASMIAVAPVLMVWTTWMQRRHGSSLADLGLTLPPSLTRFIRGWSIGVALTSLFLAVGLISGALAWAPGQTATLGDRWGTWGAIAASVGLALGFVLQGGIEELMLRGFVQRTIEEWRARAENRTVARIWILGLPAAIFAVLHGLNPGVSPLALLNTFVIGLVFGEWVLRSRSLWDVIGVHAGWNFGLAVLWSLPVSGFQMLHLLPVEARGAPEVAWWTGGVYGPEAGLICTTLAVVGWILVRALVRPELQPRG